MHQRRSRIINDLYIEASVTAMAAEAIWIRVPTRSGNDAKIKRKREQWCDIVRRRMDSKEFVQSLVFAVTVTEGYVADVLALVMKAYPSKLLVSPKGNERGEDDRKVVDLERIVAAGSLGEVLIDEARRRVQEVM